jgi:hypothetical protein
VKNSKLSIKIYIGAYTKELCCFKSYYKVYLSPYMGTTHAVSSGNCPSFSCATSSSLLMLTAGPRDRFPRWRRSRKRLAVCSRLDLSVLEIFQAVEVKRTDDLIV